MVKLTTRLLYPYNEIWYCSKKKQKQEIFYLVIQKYRCDLLLKAKHKEWIQSLVGYCSYIR
jgi:hypothetical protein